MPHRHGWWSSCAHSSPFLSCLPLIYRVAHPQQIHRVVENILGCLVFTKDTKLVLNDLEEVWSGNGSKEEPSFLGPGHSAERTCSLHETRAWTMEHGPEGPITWIRVLGLSLTDGKCTWSKDHWDWNRPKSSYLRWIKILNKASF